MPRWCVPSSGNLAWANARSIPLTLTLISLNAGGGA